MAMTRREIALKASHAAAAKRTIERDDRLIADLRSRGRLADFVSIPGQIAVSVADASTAFADLDPSPEETRMIVRYLIGFTPNGVAAAVQRIVQMRQDFEARVSLTERGEAALQHNRNYGVTDALCEHGLLIGFNRCDVPGCPASGRPADDGDCMSRARLANGGRGEVNATPGKFEAAAGPRPTPGTWCQCDWLGVGTPLHVASKLCRHACPDARRACGAETPNGPCDLAGGHPVGPMHPGYNGHLADTSEAGK